MIAHVLLVAGLMALVNAGHLIGHHHLGGLGGLGGGFGGVGEAIGVEVAHGHEQDFDYYDPPNYEYRYSVHDPHTHDVKEQTEVRVGDHTRSDLAWGEHDRHAEVHRVFHNPALDIAQHGHGWGK